MIGLGILWFMLMVACIWWAVTKARQNSWGADGQWTLAVFMGLLWIIGSIVAMANAVGYSEDIHYQRDRVAIYTTRQADLLPVVLKQLEKYPAYERDMLKDYIPKQGSIVLPPTLQASGAMVKSADEIKEANDLKYACELAIKEDQKSLRINYRVGLWFAIYIPKP